MDRSTEDQLKSFSCEKIKTDDKSTPRGSIYGIFSQSIDSTISTCNFFGLMDRFGTKQMTRAINFINPQQKWKLNNLFKKMMDKWSVLSGQAPSGFRSYPYFDCGFNEITEEFTKSLSRNRIELLGIQRHVKVNKIRLNV